MRRSQICNTTGGANAAVSSGVLNTEGTDSYLVVATFAGGSGHSWTIKAILDDNVTEKTLASGSSVADGTYVTLSIGRGTKIDLPLPRRIKFDLQAAGGGTATLFVSSSRETD
jgi:hypothetical protein